MGGRGRWLGTIAVVLTMTLTAAAQTPSSPRAIEIAVETGWLADPITFPYELRAFLKDGKLEVHGVVPSPNVRKQVVNIAKLHATTIVDHTQIVPGKAKEYVNLPPETVTAGVRAAIARGLPQLQRAIDVTSDGDGRVLLTGAVSTVAEKQRAAELLRATPGCMLVNNKIVVAGIGAIPEAPATAVINERTRIMTERIVAAAPMAKNLAVYQTGPQRYQINFSVGSEIEAQQLASRIYDIQEWKHLKLDIGARVPRSSNP